MISIEPEKTLFQYLTRQPVYFLATLSQHMDPMIPIQDGPIRFGL